MFGCIIVKEVLASKTKIYIVLELVTGGELFDEIVRETKFTEDKARFYFRQLVEGVQFCHRKGVCHRDLKPENLLLDHDKNLKISDFGLSNLYEGTNEDGSATSSRAALLHTSCGTPNYVAPEVLQDKGYDGRCADIWSIGVILYVLVAGCLPFDEPTMSVLFKKIKTADFKYPPSFSDELKDLIESILVVDPKQRASIEEIINHNWYKNSQNNSSCLDRGLNNGVQNEDKNSVSDQNISKDATWIEASEVESQNKNTNTALSCTPAQLRQKRTFLFHLNRSSVLSDIVSILQEIGCDVYDQDINNKKFKVFRMTPSGMIGLTIQIVSAPGGKKETIEIRRGKGDILEYHRFLENLISNKLRGLIEKESTENTCR